MPAEGSLPLPSTFDLRPSMPGESSELQPIALQALEFVRAGDAVGLGTGRAATAFIEALGAKLSSAFQVRGVPTSQASADLAKKLGIPLIELHEVESLDVAIDGADEVDPAGNAIKGYGGALVREKIVAAAARQFVILVGEEKLVARLGTRGKIPVEVVPFAWQVTARHLAALELAPQPRMAKDQLFHTDNGNVVLDCGTGPLADPAALEAAIRAIPGVVGTGLFLGMATAILVQRGQQVEVRQC
jgi:ribose 5-phosphate isomerase A